jgi:hypothetical protein
MVELGLKDPNKIIAGTGIPEKKVPIILRTLQDLLLVDSNVNLTEKGRKALELYKSRKTKYMKILKLTQSEQEAQKDQTPQIPRKPSSIDE